jgi:hypothetical protein
VEEKAKGTHPAGRCNPAMAFRSRDQLPPLVSRLVPPAARHRVRRTLRVLQLAGQRHIFQLGPSPCPCFLRLPFLDLSPRFSPRLDNPRVYSLPGHFPRTMPPRGYGPALRITVLLRASLETSPRTPRRGAVKRLVFRVSALRGPAGNLHAQFPTTSVVPLCSASRQTSSASLRPPISGASGVPRPPSGPPSGPPGSARPPRASPVCGTKPRTPASSAPCR